MPQEKWKCKHNDTKSMRHNESSPKREICSIIGLPQKIRKISNKQPNLTPKGLEKRQQQNPKWVKERK